MPERDDILALLLEANSPEQLLRDTDQAERWSEFVTALEREGRLYDLDHDLEITQLDHIAVGVLLKMYKYLYMEPPERVAVGTIP